MTPFSKVPILVCTFDSLITNQSTVSRVHDEQDRCQSPAPDVAAICDQVPPVM